MKSSSFRETSLAAIGAILFGAVMTAGCASKALRLEGVTGDVPFERGAASIKRGEHGTAQLDLRISKLPAIQQVNPLATEYVVWTQTRGTSAPARKIGLLAPDKTGSVRFAGQVEDADLDVFVTAETTSAAYQPGGERLLWVSIPGKPAPRRTLATSEEPMGSRTASTVWATR